MERYSLEWCDRYMDELLDKMGSDYFPRAIKYNRFVSMTYDHIHKYTKEMEINQEASDQIKTILVERETAIVRDINTITKDNIWNSPEPADYLRLVSIIPVITANGAKAIKAKKPAILKEGQSIAYERDPFRKATAEYPTVSRLESFFKINVGEDSSEYSSAFISYVKEPVFGKMEVPTQKIVNLPNIAIEKIILKTVESLRVNVGDAVSPATYEFSKTFGVKNK